MQYNREKNIEPDVLVGKIRGYWGGGGRCLRTCLAN